MFESSVAAGKLDSKTCSDVFNGNEKAKFAIGRLGIDTLMNEKSDLGDAYFRFRADVYKRVGIFNQYDCPNGVDIDEDDKRSEHFLAIENNNEDSRIVGTVRLIEKNEEHPDLLPVEHMFSGHFFGDPAANNSTEVSRLIVDCEDRKRRSLIRNGLIFSATAAVIERDLQESYSVVEPYLEKRLNQIGIETERVADMSHIPKYNTYNVGLKMDYRKFAMFIGRDVLKMMNIPRDGYLYFDEGGNGVK